MKDFFISYNKADRAWAAWIAWILEEAGYTVVIAEWDFRPGENFVLKMHSVANETKQTIAIISDAYLNAEYTQPEWAAAFARDPQGNARNLIPIKVSPCDPKGLLSQIIHIDLIGLSEEQAKARLLESLKDRAKPDVAPVFPVRDRIARHRASYPGTMDRQEEPAERMVPSNLPARIPLFVGRDQILDQLHKALGEHAASSRRIQAITGLGGIGKTQTAIEYARRFGQNYKALLWAVAESSESLRSDFGSIATLLGLPEANLQDQTSVVNAVKKWLAANDGWLLILDNADDPTLVAEFIPQSFKGAVVLTSRAQVFDNLGIFTPLELQSMSSAEAVEFLQRRSGLRDLDEGESHAAEQLASELDYLPLALEQAGAYIRELQGSFADYLESYRKRGLALLEKGSAPGKYGKSIRTTWALNFQQIAESSTASADFLRVSAFLSPDRIPMELFADAAEHLGSDITSALVGVESDPLALDELMKLPVSFSLIHRDRKTRSYSIHRLVQAVLMESMDKEAKVVWSTRVVSALEHVLLDVDKSAVSEWARIERLVPHVQRVADLTAVTAPLNTVEVVRLFNRAGRYLHLRGRLSESEKLYDEALRNAEYMTHIDDVDLAGCVHNKGWLYSDRGQYNKAEPLLVRALAIIENALDAKPRDVARSLNLLADVQKMQGRFQDSRRSYERALVTLDDSERDDPMERADSLNGLAGLHYLLGEYADAENLAREALKVFEGSHRDTTHYFVATALNNLGVAMLDQGNAEEGEVSLRRSVSIFEKVFGPDYPRLAFPLDALAGIHRGRGNYDEAEQLVARSLRIREIAFGSSHPEIAISLRHLAMLKRSKKEYAEAEALLQTALAIVEETYDSDHPSIAVVLIALVRLYLAQKKYSKAENFGRRALTIRKKRFGVESLPTSEAMLLYGQVLHGMNRKGEAQKLDAQSRKIQSKLQRKKRK